MGNHYKVLFREEIDRLVHTEYPIHNSEIYELIKNDKNKFLLYIRRELDYRIGEMNKALNDDETLGDEKKYPELMTVFCTSIAHYYGTDILEVLFYRNFTDNAANYERRKGELKIFEENFNFNPIFFLIYKLDLKQLICTMVMIKKMFFLEWVLDDENRTTLDTILKGNFYDFFWSL